MSSRDPEGGCGLILLLVAVVTLVVDLLIGWLVDWRLPLLWHLGAAIIVLAVATYLDVRYPPTDNR